MILVTGNVLEVYDLPPEITRSDADELLQDLISSGANIQFMLQDNVQYGEDPGTLPITAFQRILAIFPTGLGANQFLQTHSSVSYKLRPSHLDNMDVRT